MKKRHFEEAQRAEQELRSQVDEAASEMRAGSVLGNGERFSQTLEAPLVREELRSVIGASEADETGSKRSYILSLREELNQEKVARRRLEEQIEDLKRISSELSSQLGALRPD